MDNMLGTMKNGGGKKKLYIMQEQKKKKFRRQKCCFTFLNTMIVTTADFSTQRSFTRYYSLRYY